MSLTDLIRASSDPDKTAALIDALHFAASNAMAMVEGGSEIHKPSQQDEISLVRWLSEFEGLAGVLANAHGTRFSLSVDPALEATNPPAPAPVYLHRTLMLLLDNALKYAPGAEITLNTAMERHGSEPSMLLLSLCDTGPGFGSDTPDLLFEPYHRGAGHDAVDGKGLGLWSARHILSGLGGNITATANHPHGARFDIRLPIESRNEKKGLPTGSIGQPEEEHPHHDGATILIVDDNRTNLLILGELLKALGYLPVAAQTGAEALALLAETPLDLAIFDIHMEDMSGWDLLDRVKAIPGFAALPVFAISADEPPKDIAPFRDWIRRPIQPKELYTLIEGALAEELPA
ncbi:hybrid sensor histidine kinase/response regulator [Cohaesibacter haloalkalitolerans]|uniref:hybrid sensor histidine kinase/response regulator n=1 Tax=Cohaesibacter haloalkalitolerans TaxID=1162980 RepID=UPI0013C5247E|nr:ATP-binding protein [Cohaesibacter haloalkalitolerans]